MKSVQFRSVFFSKKIIDSDEQFDQYDDTHQYDDSHKEFDKKKDVKVVTSLAFVHEFKLFIPKKYLFNVVIDDRFLIQEFLGDGFTGFVRNGKISKSQFLKY